MIGPTPDQLKEISNSAKFSAFLPYLREEIDRLKKNVEARVFAALRNDTFSPVMADSAWREIYAFDRLLKSFETRVTMAEAAGHRLAQDLTHGE